MNQVDKFIEHVKEECKKHSVQFKEYKRKYVKLSDAIRCGGYFDDGSAGNKPTLAFAKGHPQWLSLLVHEYCHMTQWLDKLQIWDDCADSSDKIDRWLEGEDVRGSSKHFDLLLKVEVDNEKRSVRMIRKWKLPINTKDYIKRANAYLFSYHYMKTSRHWPTPDNSPYKNMNIVNAMPDKFLPSYNKLPRRFYKLYLEQDI